MYDIITIGELLVDLTQTGVNQNGDPTFAANPGGAPANVAVAAARLGARTAFLGKVGADALGEHLRDTLAKSGVDVSRLLTDPTPTTIALVALSPAGERSFSFLRGADRELTPGEVLPLPDTRVLHFGSVSLTADPAQAATLAAVRAAKEEGRIISYDPNYRAALWPDEETAVRAMAEPLPLADILKLSDEELPLLTGTDDPEAGSLALAGLGVPLVLVTLGAKGVFYRFRGKTGALPGVSVQVADTNGAGDTFLGAVLSKLVRRPAGALEGLTIPELEEILSFANRAAALTCSRSGAIPAMPTLAELS